MGPWFRGVGGAAGVHKKKPVLKRRPKVAKPKVEKKVVLLYAITELTFTPVRAIFQVDSTGIRFNIGTSFESKFVPATKSFSAEPETSFALSYGGSAVEYVSRTEVLKKDDEDVIFAFLMGLGE